MLEKVFLEKKQFQIFNILRMQTKGENLIAIAEGQRLKAECQRKV